MIVKPCCIILSLESIIMVYFLLKSGFENISKDTALSDNNNACTVTQAVLKGAKKLSFTI